MDTEKSRTDSEAGRCVGSERKGRVMELVEAYEKRARQKSKPDEQPSISATRKHLEGALTANHFLNVRFIKQNYNLFSEFKKGKLDKLINSNANANARQNNSSAPDK